MEKTIFEIFAGGITSPLSLAGLTVVLFYLVLKHIFKLPIFGPVPTKWLLNKVINFLFILALLSIFLGMGNSIFETVMKNSDKQVHLPKVETKKNEELSKEKYEPTSDKTNLPEKNKFGGETNNKTYGNKSPIISNTKGNVHLDIK